MQFFYLLCSQFRQKASNSSFYRNVLKLNTGIGFRNRERRFPVLSIIKKNKKLIPTHIFFLALAVGHVQNTDKIDTTSTHIWPLTGLVHARQ
jgi:hypothetical protein